MSARQFINLFKGHPNHDLHPVAALKKASIAVLDNPDIRNPALNYGPDEGFLPLRHTIAEWLSRHYQPLPQVTPDRITVTGGASQNLAIILSVFTDPNVTQAVWMISPTYYLACRIFDDAGFKGKLHSIPEDEEGVDVAWLDNELQTHESTNQDVAEGSSRPKTTKSAHPWRKIYRHVIYGVPTFANPSGKVMSTERREQLVRLARKYDALIVTDDVYDLLYWTPPDSSVAAPTLPPRIIDVDRTLDGGTIDDFGNAASNGSFSKIVSPGMRVGWCEATARFAWGVSQAGCSRSGGAPSQFTSTLIHNLITTGFLDEHIANTLRPSYARRHSILVSAVKRYLLPLGVTVASNFDSADALFGGYFLWLRLPDNLLISASELARIVLEKENVSFASGDAFLVDTEEIGVESLGTKEEDARRHMRFCFAHENEGLLDVGVQRIAKSIDEELKK